MKKILSLVLAVAMLLSVGVVAFAEDTIEKGTIVYGASTEIGGDFAPSAWWTNNATDNMIRKMINDYSPITTNQGGEYVLNETVAESVTGEMNPDGSKTFTVKINEGLV